MRCLRTLLAIIGVVLFSSILSAQNPENTPRIVGPIDEQSLVVLQGNVSAAARAEFDRGEAPASAKLSHVRLILSRSSAQQAALDKYDANLLDKSSPNYHKWLTPEQFGKLYGPADEDITVIDAWLEAHGLQVDPQEPGRTNVSFSGSVDQIEVLLHTSIHSFEVNGEQFYSNVINPSIPAALASVISGVAHLNTMRPKPLNVPSRPGMLDPSTGVKRPVPSTSYAGPRAELTGGTGTCPNPNLPSCSPYELYIVPGDAATIYDTPNTKFNANYTSGNNYTGQGVTIGIAGDATINGATVASYRHNFIGDTAQPTISYCGNEVPVPGAPTCSGSSSGLGIGTSDQDEAYLDTELAGGLAPGATIHYYGSEDLNGAIQAAITENTIDIFSLSFGLCELDMTIAENQLFNGWWQEASTQGIAVTVSTGDDGSAACDYQPSSGPGIAMAGLKVSGFASTPYNIAVGGTDFMGLVPTGASYSPTNFLQYVSAPSTTDASNLYRTALKYIPESTWNDSTQVDTTISANVPVTDSSGNTNVVAGSGGVSNCSVNTTTQNRGTCNSGYAKPSWQRGTGVPSDGARDLPDVSLMSGAGGDYAAWTVCTDDPVSMGITSNCTQQSDGNIYFSAFGGTSTAAPAFAGILALVQEKTGGRLGQAAKELYDLYNGSHSGTIFHDITTGNISVPCTQGTPDCSKNTAGYYFLTGYDTSIGYDLATGLGSVDAKQLIQNWGSALGTASATVTVVPNPTTLSSANSLAVTGNVSGASGTPTGSVTLSGAGYTSPTPVQLDSSGNFSTTIPGYSFKSGGTVNLTARYSGDDTYAASSGTTSITINLSTFTLSATNITLTAGDASNSANVSVVTVTAENGYSGAITLTAQVQSAPANSIDPPSFTASAPVQIPNQTQGTITVATTAVGAARKGTGRAAWLGAAGGTALTALLLFSMPVGFRRGRKVLSGFLVVVAAAFTFVGCGGGGGGGGGTGKSTPGVTVSATGGTTFATTASIPVTVSVSGSPTPTGTVTLSSGTYTSAATTLSSSGGATITIPANTFAAGSVTLTASYSGDSNYTTATGTESLTIAKPGTTAGTYTIQVTGTGNDPAATTAITTFTLTVN